MFTLKTNQLGLFPQVDRLRSPQFAGKPNPAKNALRKGLLLSLLATAGASAGLRGSQAQAPVAPLQDAFDTYGWAQSTWVAGSNQRRKMLDTASSSNTDVSSSDQACVIESHTTPFRPHPSASQPAPSHPSEELLAQIGQPEPGNTWHLKADRCGNDPGDWEQISGSAPRNNDVPKPNNTPNPTDARQHGNTLQKVGIGLGAVAGAFVLGGAAALCYFKGLRNKVSQSGTRLIELFRK